MKPKSSSKFSKQMRKLSLGALVVLVMAITFQFLWKTPSTILSETANSFDLTGEWQLCILSDSLKSDVSACHWEATKIPSAISISKLSTTKGWLVYRKTIASPATCLDKENICNFVIGEVGDAVQLSINGQKLGRHGGFPPNDKYAKHFPVRFDIPATFIKASSPNEIELIVRYLKKSQSGILRGPIALVSNDSGVAISRTILMQNVLLPLFSALGVALLTLLTSLMIFINKISDTRLKVLATYGAIAALFLTSYTGLPREHITLAFAGCLHFMLRFIMDGAFFELASEILDLKKSIRYVVRTIYSAVILCFPVLYILDGLLDSSKQHLTGFSGSVLLSGWVDYVLVAGPYFFAAISAVIHRTRLSKTVVGLFLIVSPLPLLGTLTFHGVVSLPHFVCFFPFFVVLVLSIEFWSEFFVTQAKLVSEGKLGRMATQVAHDIQSPLAALVSFSKTAHGLPDEQKLVLRQATLRIQNIAGELISQYKSLNNDEITIDRSITLASQSIRAIVSEKLAILGKHSRIAITVDIPPQAEPINIRISPVNCARILSNILNNAIDALSDSQFPWIEINVALEGKVLQLSVKDNGKGIPKDALIAIQSNGGNFNKPGGSGIGLRHARETLTSIGGKLRIDSRLFEGTTVIMQIPVARTDVTRTNSVLPKYPHSTIQA